MKNTILTLLIGLASVSVSSAALQNLISKASASGTAGSTTAVSVSSTEAVIFHGYLDTGNYSCVANFSIGTSYFYASISTLPGKAYPGPLSFSLYSSPGSFGGMVTSQIVDAAVYAKNGHGPAGKEQFLAAAQPQRKLPAPQVLPAQTAGMPTALNPQG